MPWNQMLQQVRGLSQKAKSSGQTLQAPSNPGDPNQAMRWMIEQSSQAANVPLYAPDALKQMQDMLAPYFQAQKNAFVQGSNQMMNAASSNATNTARAEAAFRGVNPQSFMQSANARTMEGMTPSFFNGLQNLNIDQLNKIFGMTGESQKFKSQNQWNLANQYGNLAQMGQQQQMLDAQPNLWEYLTGGLFGAASEFASPFLGYGGKKLGKDFWG